jgi:hypothetical protein
MGFWYVLDAGGTIRSLLLHQELVNHPYPHLRGATGPLTGACEAEV